MNRTCWQGSLLQICSTRYVLILSNPNGHNLLETNQIWLVAGTLRGSGRGESKYSMEASHELLTSKMWAAIRHFQPGSLPGPAELLAKSCEKSCEKFWLIAGHFSRKRCTTGCLPRCSFSKHSCPRVQSPLLWPMEALPARLSSGVPMKVSLQLYRACAFPCCIYPLRFPVFSLGSPW